MWQKIPLNTKLIVSLLFVHVIFYFIAAEFLIQWNQSTRMNELQHRLDIHADFVEDVVEVKRDGLVLNPNSEIRRELDHDKNSYFILVQKEHEIIDESKGPSAEVIAQLRGTIHISNPNLEKAYLIKINDESWLAQSEIVERTLQDRNFRAMSHTAIKVQPILDDISSFEHMIVVSSILFSLMASMASGIVVSFSTRNLRKFARGLRSSNPMNIKSDIEFSFKPLSSEEFLLHDSYRDMVERIKKSAESQRLFIAHASHELKTPIASALVATELSLSRRRTIEEYEQAHREVLDELKVLKRLSMTLLDFASLEQANYDYRGTGECELSAILDLVTERWATSAREKNIAVQITNKFQINVPGRAELWETVFSNLVENAIKYGRHDGLVKLTMQMIGQGIVSISVEDDGIGISAKDLVRMGEVFFKADFARSKLGSFGLGFAHAQRIVQRLGGEVRIQSTLGKGTIVVVAAGILGS